METQTTPKHIRQTLREIAETAAKLDDLIRSLSPSRTVPTYWNGVPADWPELPWGDTFMAKALFATSGLKGLLDDPEEEQAWLYCEVCDEPDCYDDDCRGRGVWYAHTDRK